MCTLSVSGSILALGSGSDSWREKGKKRSSRIRVLVIGDEGAVLAATGMASRGFRESVE
jgi:hypothetical protein